MKLRVFSLLAGSVLIVGMALTTSAFDASLPNPVHVQFSAPKSGEALGKYKPPVLGVGVHFGSVRVLGYKSGDVARQQFSEIGVDSFRDGLAWAAFSFPPNREPNVTQHRRIMDFLPTAGLPALMVLGGSSVKLAPTGMPFSDKDLADFAAYVRQIVKTTKTTAPIFEVWNEWNMRVADANPGHRIAGEGDPSDGRAAIYYARLAKIGVAAVKETDPTRAVLVGAVGEDPNWEWTKAVVRDGALEHADGLSVHLYNHCLRPENRNADEMITRVTALQSMLKQIRNGVETPIYVTEYGWPTADSKCFLSRAQQAYNFAHFILQASTVPWIRGMWAYELKDGDKNPPDIESNFGLFDYDDKPKEAVCFVREASEIVRKARKVELKRPAPGIFVIHAVMDDRQLAIMWTNDLVPKQRRIEAAGVKQPVRQMCGGTVTDPAEARLSQNPLIATYDLAQPISIEIEN